MNRRTFCATLLVAAVVLGACSSAAPEPVVTTPATTVGTTTTAPSTTAPTTTVPTTTVPTTASRPAPTTAPITATSPTAAPTLPPISAQARAAGLRDVRTVVPDARIDLRYATSDNFTGTRLYPRDARCLVHESMTSGLAAAGRAARRAGLQLVFWDCYRPHSVQVRMFEIVPNPTFVARPGPYARSHEAGRSVDVTLARNGTLLDMGTGFDSFSDRAAAYATTDVSSRAERNRALLRKIMRRGGLQVYSGEWWHFDGPGAATNRPQLDAPVR